ncbi:hypothetical protein [uncultured Winogradskyella sp.]|uniref:hypothetical protein n=1 Tax=uncultured Winogradskyella sp. TaxID=395353 RepID=UPI00260EE670|nr:hypothetical protein [uncultured Winogradskyella sp.]
MAFSLSKLLGSKTPEVKSQSGDTVEAIIRDVENRPYGVAENNVLFAGLNELGGYFFFQTVIVGQLHVKSKTGASLFFIGNDLEMKLDSDTLEFESEYSDIKGRSVTKIDFQIEESDIKQLENRKPNSVELKLKKQNILFTKYVVSDGEE